MTDLTGLVERLEKCTGPSSLLDAEIAATLGVVPHTFAGERMVPLVAHGETWPAYTASVDAALALVVQKMPGWSRRSYARAGDCRVFLWDPRSMDEAREFYALAPTEPLAIILALLRALPQIQEKTNGQ